MGAYTIATGDAAGNVDFALETAEDRVDALLRIETLLGPHALERFRKACFDFADEQTALSVGRLRMILQIEDHLDWLLRNDQPRLQLWRLDARRSNALSLSNQIADMWQALGVCLGRYVLDEPQWGKTQRPAIRLAAADDRGCARLSCQ